MTNASFRSSKKKKQQLGMSQGTARNRLIKQILFRLVTEADYKCHRCGQELTEKDLSIEHIEPWLDSDDPVRNYFSQENIAFSHLSCNVVAANKSRKKGHCYNGGCRCDECKEWNARRVRQNYTPDKRRKKYLRTGS